MNADEKIIVVRCTFAPVCIIIAELLRQDFQDFGVFCAKIALRNCQGADGNGRAAAVCRRSSGMIQAGIEI